MLKLIRDVLLYGSGDLLARVVGVLMLAVLARSVPAAELGMFSVIVVATIPLALLISFGGDSTFTRFYLDTPDPRQRRRIAASWVTWTTAVALAALGVIWLGREPLADALTGDRSNAPVVLLGLATLPVTVIGTTIAHVLRLQGRAAEFIGVNLGTQLIYVTLGAAAVLALGIGITGVFAASLLALALMLPVRLWMVRGELSARASPEVLRHMLPYGAGAMATAAGPCVLLFADRLVVGQWLGLEMLAHYSIAGTLQSLLVLGVGVVGQAWLPTVLGMRLQTPDAVAAFAARAATQLMLVFSTAAVLVMALADNLILLLAGPAFADAQVAVPGLALASVAFGMSLVTGLGLQIAKCSGRAALASLIAAGAGVVVILFLTPRLGILGAACGTAAGYATLALLLARASQTVMPIAYEWLRLAGLAALLISFAVLSRPAATGSLLLDLAAAAMMVLPFIAAGALIAGISGDLMFAGLRALRARVGGGAG